MLHLIQKHFSHAEKTPRDCARESRHMRENLSEQEIDKTLEDSFPASDPPAWY